MSLRPFKHTKPQVATTAYVDAAAVVIGDVVIGADSSVWPMCVLRGDVNGIRIGARTSIQDGTVIHVTGEREASIATQTVVGDEVTVGHRCLLHGCTIENGCLVGMGSIILDRAVLRQGVLLGAGSLVTEGKELEGGYLWLGSPAKKIRPLTPDERALIRNSAEHYARFKEHHRRK
jgi:carbonic anhydrase/acetyltransferase-like protein (isoleucine patch superfamily)